MGDYLEVANSWTMWLAVTPVLILMVIQALLFMRKAREIGKDFDLPEEDSKQAFFVGMRTAIGPSMSIFVVMLGLMGVIGGPLAWQRLTIIGGASTEMASATQAATAMGVNLGGEGYGLEHFANAAWVMGLNGGAWLLFTALFTDKMGTISDKLTGGNPKRVGLLSISAISGAFAYLVMNQVIRAIKNLDVNPDSYRVIVAAVTGGVVMALCTYLSNRFKFLTEYKMGIAMFAGMAAAVIF